MEAKTFFITGTDTDVGKTFAACILLQAAKKKGISTAAVKPIAAGGILTSAGLQNEDALLLQKNCSVDLSYKEVNAVCLDRPIAPHIAAQQEGVTVQANELAEHCKKVINKKADLTLIEGAGGWLVPLNQKEFIGDVVKALNIPVILVIGLKLGCLNHALLTVRALQEEGVILHGWIANQLNPKMPACEENLETLQAMIKAPLITFIPWQSSNKSADLSGEIQINNLF
ncbi:dethiobiotin synthase [Haliea sp. AH-315-K21]|uniref:ATP-dependent dethiobiotin synthetase BioD n=1 Tax=SAR86 cluster bacterium TaxID=2030880 RepID=A0A2A5CK30_9GAMM|nr:dethiobiotin synthase [Haliea sp. AH-315-K21]MBN4059704.1 dethiobiotin synthase [bacterium AH-315-I11]MBN4075231.1 dethiobiotin synthase [Gammaproteobacteria bacterium AH-315-E17]PCJ43770.1 MAG: dethiobiotin synthase [SAR86 cluster bacterium]